MTSNPSLLIDLAGIARLAEVQRPVVSMWRTRFAAAAVPFPCAVDERGGRMLFDAAQVAEWLTRTEHGNNREARADAAAAATPPGFSFSHRQSVAEIEALITLYSQRGALVDLSPATLRTVAADTDPQDDYVRSELEAHAERGADWLSYAELLIDAAYSPSGALALVARRRATSLRPAGSDGHLADDVIELVAEATRALVLHATDGGDDVTAVLDPHDAELTAALAEELGDEAELSLPVGADARRSRRRLVTDGRWLSAPDAREASRSVVVARVPAGRGDDAVAMLRAIDDVALGMGALDSAVVIGPARAMVDGLDPAAELVRSDILRTGRIRGVARLTPGLVESTPREALALWVLGAPMAQVTISERFTLVADLTDVALTSAARADLVSDLLASLGTRGEVRAHAFRFARPVRTSTLLARGGSILGSMPSPATQRVPRDAHELPALLDTTADAVRGDIEPLRVIPATDSPRSSVAVADAVRDGHLRVVPGTRLDSTLHGTEGLIVVSAADLDDPGTIGSTRVDQFAFATLHPSAALTQPGDVIFRTGPTAAAWVDVEGSKIVGYTARVLRVTAGDAGGLVPELIAIDIIGQAAGPGAWNRWLLRRVSPRAITPLRGRWPRSLRGATHSSTELPNSIGTRSSSRAVSPLEQWLSPPTPTSPNTPMPRSSPRHPLSKDRHAPRHESRPAGAVNDEGAERHALEGRRQTARIDGCLAVQRCHSRARLLEVRVGCVRRAASGHPHRARRRWVRR
ncbi:hypothetical protein HNR16_003576 [Pseudoclavibacter chungangensis]|nr:hypothetical protein [Pseudoclavibacter chungangensis]